MDKYYVYAYLRKSTGQPYYIGKGLGRRAFVKHCWAKTPKDKSQIVFIQRDLSESQALDLEKELIRKWGRLNNSTGILLNLTDGGEGVSGLIHNEDTKTRISRSAKSLNQNVEWKEARLAAIKKSNLASIGVEFPMQSNEIWKKGNAMLLKKHGVTNPSQLKTVKEAKRKMQQAAGSREIVKMIKRLNGPRGKRIIPLGRGWYRKSNEELQSILDEFHVML